MTTPSPPICLDCTHFHEDNEEALTCDAFPDGIPDAIIFSEHDHREPYERDNGIRFEPRKPSGGKDER